jgi:hypothetical protein
MLDADRQTGDLVDQVSMAKAVVMSTKPLPSEDMNGLAKSDAPAAGCLDAPSMCPQRSLTIAEGDGPVQSLRSG